MAPSCEHCGLAFFSTELTCSQCAGRKKLPECSVCRLPVKGEFIIFIWFTAFQQSLGLSRTCSRCLHATHMSCWDASKVPACGTGCGCVCPGLIAEIPILEPARLVRSPRSILSALPSIPWRSFIYLFVFLIHNVIRTLLPLPQAMCIPHFLTIKKYNWGPFVEHKNLCISCYQS